MANYTNEYARNILYIKAMRLSKSKLVDTHISEDSGRLADMKLYDANIQSHLATLITQLYNILYMLHFMIYTDYISTIF